MRLIDADVVLQKLALMLNYCESRTMGREVAVLFQVADAVMDCPTIEAEPVRHGEWRIFRDGCVLLAECSACGTVQSGIAAAQWDYCPMCGCRMDGGADNDQL